MSALAPVLRIAAGVTPGRQAALDLPGTTVVTASPGRIA